MEKLSSMKPVLGPKYTEDYCQGFSSVQSLSRVWLFATPWIAGCQASLSITNSQSHQHITHHNSHTPDAEVGWKTMQPQRAKATATTISRKLFSPVALFHMSALWIQHLSPTIWLTYSTCLPQTCKGSWDNEFLRELEIFSRYGKYDQKYLSGISLAVQWEGKKKAPKWPHYR